MAITDAPVTWEIRTTGNNNNGGGFCKYVPSPGTDYSQQDTPAVTGNDLEIDGTDARKFRSTSGLINDTHIGNILYVTGGTGFTVGRFLIYSAAGGGWYNVHPLGATLGTTGSTNGQFTIGGALGSTTAIESTFAAIENTYNVLHGTGSLADNVIWIGGGTYTMQSSSIVINGDLIEQPVLLKGYNNQRGDLDDVGCIDYTSPYHSLRPKIDIQAGGTNLFSISNSTTLHIYNLYFEINSGGLDGLGWLSPLQSFVFFNTYINCNFTSFLIFGTTTIGGVNLSGLEMRYNTSIPIILTASNGISVENCRFYDCNVGIIDYTINNGQSGTNLSVSNCIFSRVGGAGTQVIKVSQTSGGAANTTISDVSIRNCLFSGCSVAVLFDGKYGRRLIQDCIFVFNTTGIQLNNYQSQLAGLQSINYNAFYGQFVSDIDATGSPFSSNPDSYTGGKNIQLTANPFIDVGNDDFSLTSTGANELNGNGRCGAAIGPTFLTGCSNVFSETLKPTRDHHWNIAKNKISDVINGVVEDSNNNSGILLSGTDVSQTMKVASTALGKVRIIDVAESHWAVSRIVAGKPFAPTHSLFNFYKFELDSRQSIHRVKVITSEHFTAELRSGRWNAFKNILTDDLPTSAGGAWDQTTDADEAKDLTKNQTDKAAHPTKDAPGRRTLRLGGRIVSSNYPKRGIF